MQTIDLGICSQGITEALEPLISKKKQKNKVLRISFRELGDDARFFIKQMRPSDSCSTKLCQALRYVKVQQSDRSYWLHANSLSTRLVIPLKTIRDACKKQNLEALIARHLSYMRRLKEMELQGAFFPDYFKANLIPQQSHWKQAIELNSVEVLIETQFAKVNFIFQRFQEIHIKNKYENRDGLLILKDQDKSPLKAKSDPYVISQVALATIFQIAYENASSSSNFSTYIENDRFFICQRNSHLSIYHIRNNCQELGEGWTGNTIKVLDILEGEHVALKSSLNDKKVPILQGEFEKLSTIHQRLNQKGYKEEDIPIQAVPYQVIPLSKNGDFITEIGLLEYFYNRGDLFDFSETKEYAALSFEERCAWCKRLLWGLFLLSEADFSHSDIKNENIFISLNGTYRLDFADLGGSVDLRTLPDNIEIVLANDSLSFKEKEREIRNLILGHFTIDCFHPLLYEKLNQYSRHLLNDYLKEKAISKVSCRGPLYECIITIKKQQDVYALGLVFLELLLDKPLHKDRLTDSMIKFYVNKIESLNVSNRKLQKAFCRCLRQMLQLKPPLASVLLENLNG